MRARARSRDGARPRSTINTSRRTLLLAMVERAKTHSTFDRTLVPAADNPIRDGPQPAVLEACVVEDGLGLAHTIGGHRSRAFEAEKRRIAGLGARGILARAFAERCSVALDIQDVVHDLERKPDQVSEALDPRHECIVCTRHD